MIADLHIDDPVSDGERDGVVMVILQTPRRGLGGADVVDVRERWTDGSISWTTPDALVECGAKPGA